MADDTLTPKQALDREIEIEEACQRRFTALREQLRDAEGLAQSHGALVELYEKQLRKAKPALLRVIEPQTPYGGLSRDDIAALRALAELKTNTETNDGM